MPSRFIPLLILPDAAPMRTKYFYQLQESRRAAQVVRCPIVGATI
jgi:hypothetical protein